MTTTVASIRPASMLPPTTVAPSVGLGALTRVEVRKLVDTRAGRWLLVIALVGTLAGVALWWSLLDTLPATLGWLAPLSIVGGPIGALLPVLAILSFTQEWSQRTSITTFSLEPRRGRVIGAKLLAIALTTLVGTAVGVAASAVTSAVSAATTDATIAWTFDLAPLGSFAVTLLISMAIGSGFGLLLMNSPAAIALYFIIPTATATMAMLPGPVGAIGHWISGETWGLVFTPMTTTQWAQAATALALWAVAPLALGCWRTLRAEAK